MNAVETTTPTGCLGCNHDAVAKVLTDGGIELLDFTEVPPTRHEWADVVPCHACGRFWLIQRERK